VRDHQLARQVPGLELARQLPASGGTRASGVARL